MTPHPKAERLRAEIFAKQRVIVMPQCRGAQLETPEGAGSASHLPSGNQTPSKILRLSTQNH